MLNKIIQCALHNRLSVLVLAALLLIGGAYTAAHMEVDVFPDLNAPTVVVMTEANGMAAEEVEQLVTFQVETAVNGATGVRRVRSSSTTGFSIVWVEFDWDTDIYRARQIVSEKLAMVQEALPAGVGIPTLGPQSSILGELLFVAITADTTSMQQLRTLADWSLRPRLLAMGGVAQVAVLGGEVKEYQILLHPDRMRHYGVGIEEVCQAVQGMTQNVSGGVLNEYGNEYIIRGVLSTVRVEEMRRAVVKLAGGKPVCLDAVARVEVGNHFPKMGTASYNTQPAVVLTVTKQPNTRTIELTETIDGVLEDLKTTLPPDVQLHTDVYRQSRFIESSINNVKNALLEGGVFVAIVLFLFLMNVRTTVISLITIPLSLLVSVVALQCMGLTINTMSLGGMCIAIGSLVDDAIVDVENVYKRLRENRLLPVGQRKGVIEVVYNASREVRTPILNSTLIIVACFVPLFFLQGMEGRMLAPLGVAFIVALCSSTVVALTLTPVLCSYLLGADGAAGRQAASREPWVSRSIRQCYEGLLRRVMTRPRRLLAATGLLLVVSVVVFLSLGRSFLPSFNEGSFTINVNTLPGASIEESDRMGALAEKALLEVPEIRVVGRKTGRAELDEHALGVNTSEIEVPFELGHRSKDELLADVRRRLNAIPGVSVEVGAPISHRIDAMLSGTRAGIAIKLFGSDLNRMYALANQVKEAVEGIEGVVDLNVEQQVERPQLQIVPRREMLAMHGIPMSQFRQMVGLLLAGETVSQVYEGNRAFNLVLKADGESRLSADDIRQMAIDAAGGKVPLGQVADVVSTTGPNTIGRENVMRKVVVSANVAGRDLGSVVADMQRAVRSGVELPEGYRVEYGGQFESGRAASRTLLLASAFSLMVIFMLLFQQFRSVRQSALVLLNLPLALIGGVLTLWLSGGEVSIPAVIGFISLFGIATRNGILLVARYNDLRREGLTVWQSVARGSLDRLNPILMTALTSALALIPMVIGGDLPGNEIQSPMAKVILGGLLTSTLLNAFITPIVYLITNREKQADDVAADTTSL